MSKELGKRIQQLMALRGVSNSQMAKHCDVTSGAVSNWYGKGRISKPNLSKVAEKLRTTTDRLIKYDVEEILELEEADRSKGAKGAAAMLDQARSVVGRQSYSLDALQIAYVFDQLPGELERRRATAYVENLMVRNPVLETSAAELAAPAPRARRAPQKRSSVKPTGKPRTAPKTSRAKTRA